MSVSKQACGPEAAREIVLPARLDVAICGSLSEELKAAQGRPLTLDASGVEFLGAMVLQLLISARRQWRIDGLPFHVRAPSGAFCSGLALLGYAHAPFEEGAPA
ncbi:STAS domain-containing protein [Rhodalgimonas zhirmunskyi]|uniref:STAS domain-containing protein n=1 Tax=Rhodalgimonas zhirmunskyi TaxID=2964767 RepID=A0AAJ1UGL1_9RHOB|nr:STAS domain-containing protein [Rhodoalgimonas zhirmunskyi]MDQ2095711.1 STAS domain-containing protein [Rhodoalgimonas zhirmunskyi]